MLPPPTCALYVFWPAMPSWLLLPTLTFGTRRISCSEPATTALPAALSVKRLITLWPTTRQLLQPGSWRGE